MLFLAAVIGFWVFVLFLDGVFKSCMLPPYINLLNSGFTVKLLMIQFCTSRWNRTLQKWGCWRPRYQKLWFNCGVLCTCLLMPIAIFFLAMSLKNMVTSLLIEEVGDERDQIPKYIQPVLPGINIPISDLPYFLVTLLISSVLHEIGHAMAATREDVRVQEFGFFFMGIFPGAFVNLPSDQMSCLTAWQRLRIFCAGVWHNVVLALLCMALLVTTPILTRPLYEQGTGCTVVNVLANSGVAGPAGLRYGDVIESINFCPVTNALSWTNCIDEQSKTPKIGFCAPGDVISELANQNAEHYVNNINCCSSQSQSHVCFSYKTTKEMEYKCLPARKVLDYSSGSCKSSTECKQSSEICILPAINQNNTDQFRLVPIERRGLAKVIFLGPTRELYSAVTLNDYVSRYGIFSVKIMHVWETFLKYVISFSGALAILNVVPCFYLDGKFIITDLIEFLFSPNIFNAKTRKFCVIALTWAGTCMFLSLVIFGIFTLLKT